MCGVLFCAKKSLKPGALRLASGIAFYLPLNSVPKMPRTICVPMVRAAVLIVLSITLSTMVFCWRVGRVARSAALRSSSWRRSSALRSRSAACAALASSLACFSASFALAAASASACAASARPVRFRRPIHGRRCAHICYTADWQRFSAGAGLRCRRPDSCAAA